MISSGPCKSSYEDYVRGYKDYHFTRLFIVTVEALNIYFLPIDDGRKYDHIELLSTICRNSVSKSPFKVTYDL